MKILKLLLISLILFVGCKKDQNTESEKFHYVSFHPNLLIGKGDNIKLDLDGNNSSDIIFFVDSTITLEGFKRYGVYVTFMSDTVEFTYGYMNSQLTFPIEMGDALNHPYYYWFDFLTLDGEVRHNGHQGRINYLGVRKPIGKSFQKGWINLVTTDSTLIIKELFFALDTNIVVKAGIKDY